MNNDRSKENIFFMVLFNDDLWKEFKKWMFPNKKSSNFYDYKNGDIAAYHGYIGLIKESTQLEYSSSAIDNASEQGQLKVIKFLHINRKQGCSNVAMIQAIENGHLEVAQYLFFVMNKPLSNILMVNAIEGLQTDIVKFLYENRGSYKFNKDQAIRLAKTKGYLEILYFLENN